MKKFKSICEADTRVSVKGTKSNYAVWRFIKNIGRGTFLDRQSTLGTGIIGEDFLKVAKKILEDNITVYTKTGEKIAINPNLDEDFSRPIFVSKDPDIEISFDDFFAITENKKFHGHDHNIVTKAINKAARPLMLKLKLQPFHELYWDWLENLHKELAPTSREAFPDYGGSIYSPAELITGYIVHEIHETISKMHKKFKAWDFDKEYEYDPVWLFSKMFWDSDRNDYYIDGVVRKGCSKYFKDSGGYFYLGDLSDEEWAKAINKVFYKRDKIISKWEKSESKIISDMIQTGLEAGAKELVNILKETGLFGKTFLAVKNPGHWIGKERKEYWQVEGKYALVEIKDKSEIEELTREFEQKYDDEEEKYMKRLRNSDDDISTPSGWANHFGTAHDF